MTGADELRAAMRQVQADRTPDPQNASRQARDRANYDKQEAVYIEDCVEITKAAIAALNAAGNPGQIQKKMETWRFRSNGIYDGWDWGPHLLRPDGAIFVGDARTPQTQKVLLEDWVAACIRAPRTPPNHEHRTYDEVYVGPPLDEHEHFSKKLRAALDQAKADLTTQLANLLLSVNVTP